jgi:hypothetical protein
MTQYQEIAFQFASALMNGDFSQAHSRLSQCQQAQVSPNQLKETYREMIEYFGGPAQTVEVIQVMDNWPQKKQNDVGWAYVTIDRTTPDGSFSEAVTVVVAEENDCQVIREINWGRP